MSTELNVFIIVAISVSAVTIAVMILARRFRGPQQQQQQQQQDGSNTPQSQRYRIQPSRRRIVQFRPSNRPVKPYNPFSKDELQLLPTVNLTQTDVDRLNMQKPESFSKEDVTKELTEEAVVAFDNDDGKVLESGLRYASPECTICLVSYEKADVVRILSCSHTYHADCIDVWLTERSARCPICKMDIRQALGLEKRRLAHTSAGANPGTLEDNDDDDDEEEEGDDESSAANSGAHHVVEIRRPQPALIPSNV